MIYKISYATICGIFLLFLANRLVSNESNNPQGYTDIVHFKNTFIAVGSDGRIDRISKSGESVTIDHSSQNKLNCAFSNDEILIAAGDHGKIMYSNNGKDFYPAESGTDRNIYGIALKNGLIIAGTEHGKILTSREGQSWRSMQTDAKGNVLSLSANPSFFIGITDEGEIIKSFDGMNWEIKDYNEEYAGYHEYSKFSKILAVQHSIIIIGTHHDGSPSILFSSLGNVWTERLPFYYDDGGMVCHLTQRPNDIAYDPIGDQFILACDTGVLISLPNCTKCNKAVKIAESDLDAIICVDHCLWIAGSEYSVFNYQL